MHLKTLLVDQHMLFQADSYVTTWCAGPPLLLLQRVQQRIREVAIEMLEISRQKKIAAAAKLVAAAAGSRKRSLYDIKASTLLVFPQAVLTHFAYFVSFYEGCTCVGLCAATSCILATSAASSC